MLKLKQETFKDIITINGKEREVLVDTRVETPMGETMLKKINKFEKRAWDRDETGLATGFPMLDNAFQKGLVPGFYVVAADSNVGKSTLVTQMTYQMLDLNDDVFVLDFSLDDPMDDKLSRLVGSWVKMDSSEVKFPKNREDHVIERRKLGMYKLYNNADNYLAYDTNFGNDIDKIGKKIESIREEIGEDKPFVVVIDSFHDLAIDKEPSLTDTAKFNKIAQWAADISIRLDIILICTCEMKKPDKDGVRPSVSLIKDSTKIKYEAKAIMLLFNEVHYKQDSADIYFNAKDDLTKLPVLEVHVFKNKISGYKGRLFYYMWPEKGYLKECNEEATRRFRALI